MTVMSMQPNFHSILGVLCCCFVEVLSNAPLPSLLAADTNPMVLVYIYVKILHM